MRPKLDPEKKRRSFTVKLPKETIENIQIFLSYCREELYFRFTKTDLVEMALYHLMEKQGKTNILTIFKKYDKTNKKRVDR